MKKLLTLLTLLTLVGTTTAQEIKIKSPIEAVQTFTQHKEYKKRVVNKYFAGLDRVEEFVDSYYDSIEKAWKEDLHTNPVTGQIAPLIEQPNGRKIYNETKLELNKESKKIKKKIKQARRILKTIKIDNSVDYLDLFEKTNEVDAIFDFNELS